MKIQEYKKSDRVMQQLLACDKDIERINNTLMELGSAELSLEEIGLILGVTRERVRQIENSALRKLKNPTVGRRLQEYLHI